MKQKANKSRKVLTFAKIVLPYECVCGKEESCSTEKGQLKKGDFIITLCKSCQTVAFVKIDELYPGTEEIAYTVRIGVPS